MITNFVSFNKRFVAEVIAKVKGIPIDDVVEAAYTNTIRVFFDPKS